MAVVKLNETHCEAVKNLFYTSRYLGIETASLVNNFDVVTNEREFNTLLYDVFCANYLSDLKNFHAYGYIENGIVRALISFYESDEEPSWYYTVYRSDGNNNLLRPVLDAVIEHNESRNRFKFYTLVHEKHSKLLRRFHWSKYNDSRYGYFDEFIVPSKNKCFYTNHWELLYKRMLMPEASIVRCNYLKQEYRTTLPIGGNL
jgi:hypothetical protein